jgi:hypothetical protein
MVAAALRNMLKVETTYDQRQLDFPRVENQLTPDNVSIGAIGGIAGHVAQKSVAKDVEYLFNLSADIGSLYALEIGIKEESSDCLTRNDDDRGNIEETLAMLLGIAALFENRRSQLLLTTQTSILQFPKQISFVDW